MRRAVDVLVESAKPIPLDQARAREALWTPDKDAGEGPRPGGRLWTPGRRWPLGGSTCSTAEVAGTWRSFRSSSLYGRRRRPLAQRQRVGPGAVDRLGPPATTPGPAGSEAPKRNRSES